MMQKFGLYIPTRLVFGAGELKNLSQQPLPGKKALIVISSGTSMKKYGYLDLVQKQLAQAGVESEVFDKILPNPIQSGAVGGRFSASRSPVTTALKSLIVIGLCISFS